MGAACRSDRLRSLAWSRYKSSRRDLFRALRGRLPTYVLRRLVAAAVALCIDVSCLNLALERTSVRRSASNRETMDAALPSLDLLQCMLRPLSCSLPMRAAFLHAVRPLMVADLRCKPCARRRSHLFAL